MTKSLFKKQLLEVFSWIFQNRKTGKKRTGAGLVGFIFLYVFVFGYIGFIFYMLADFLCEPLVSTGFGWLYMILMGLLSIVLGVFGSVFNTYATLYNAKDNDMLLSMPIPPRVILLVRLVGVYLMGLLYELLVMIPCIIVYFLNARISPIAVVFTLLIPIFLSFFILTLSCILGYVVALIGSRLKNKNIITVLVSLGFIAAYYYLYSKAYNLIGSILENPAVYGDKAKTWLYPFYHMGLAADGNALSMLIFIAIVAVLFAVVYAILSYSFLGLATANRGSSKVKYKEKEARLSSANSALLKKEFKRFLGSPTYMLNCGLGLILMLIAAVVLVVKNEWVSQMLLLFIDFEEFFAPLAIASICMMTSTNCLTAPSVSLEGKNFWLVQVYPVSPLSALMAKLKIHLILTLIPTLILSAAFVYVLMPEPIYWLLIPLVSCVYVLLFGLIGLCLNLKFPNLTWTNEAIPVKQSLPVTLSLFGGWVGVFGLGALYILIMEHISALVYILSVTVLFIVASLVLFMWLKTRGAKIFSEL